MSLHETDSIRPHSTLQWTLRENMPLPRGGNMAGVIDGRMIVAGGSYWEGGKKQWTAQVDSFDPATNRWQSCAPMPLPRSDAAVITVDNALYIFGGGTHTEVRRDAWAFQDGIWSALTHAELPQGRLYPVTVSHRGLIYLTAGLSQAGNYTTASTTLWVWNPQSPQAGWKELPSIPGPGRTNHAAVTLGDNIFILGGTAPATPQGVRNLDDAYCYNIPTAKWKQLPNLPIGRRAWWGVPLESTILLLGGYTQTYERDVFEYHPFSAELVKIEPLPHGIADAKFVRIGDLLLGAGGEADDRIRGQWTFQAQLPAA